jgi:hypothetical protein
MRLTAPHTALLALLMLFVTADPLIASRAHPTMAQAPAARLRYQPEAKRHRAVREPEARWVRPRVGRQRVETRAAAGHARDRREAVPVPVKKVGKAARRIAPVDRVRMERVRVRRVRVERVAVERVREPRVVPMKPVVNVATADDTPSLTSATIDPVLPVTNVEDTVKAIDPVEDAMGSTVVAGLYDDRGRLNMPAALKGSHEILVRQNVIADQDGLVRIQDDDDLLRMRQKRMLVPIPTSEGLRIDERLPENRRFCRPWVAQFLIALGRAHYAQFHVPLQVNSAVRTVSFQLRLMRTNGNAAPANGETASPHLTGQAIDIGKKGLSQAEIAWLRLYLTPILEDGKIDVEEEFQQACFHVSVYRKYGSMSVNAPHIASTHRTITPALAPTLE